MQTVDFLQNIIANKLLQEQKESKRKEELVGKLSGSILGHPLQTQILHMIGVPTEPIDEYTLRKFQRGHHVEKWILEQMPGFIDTQEGVEYRGAVGHIDALIDMEKWDMPKLGKIPHEIKSTSNASFKWIARDGAKWTHKLQACMYAMALESPAFMIHYVAADDYRIASYLFKTEEMAEDVDRIIDEVIEQLKTGRLPVFIAREDWQNNKDYQNYPQWSSLGEDEANEKLQKEHPAAYKNLLAYAKV
jgi:CRISPR/Cas system-associated exonuclease Cas4 (RecB family)